MGSVDGRIWFPESPWPEGHAIVAFAWTGRLDATGTLWFDMHLEAADYDAEKELEDVEEEAGDWKSPIVWNNYGNCTLSSTFWEGESTGLRVGTPDNPLNWEDLVTRGEVSADPANQGESFNYDADPAFRVYLLGHDGVADHRVRFRAGKDAGRFDIEWTGRVALVYTGDDEFKYTFRAVVRGIPFGGFSLPDGMDAEEGRRLFGAACADAGRFTLSTEQRFVPRR